LFIPSDEEEDTCESLPPCHMRRRIHASLSLHVMGLLFIPSGPRTKLCAWEEEDSEGHVLWEGCRKRENENERDREEAGRGGGGGGKGESESE
jgi:hypothetical protein